MRKWQCAHLQNAQDVPVIPKGKGQYEDRDLSTQAPGQTKCQGKWVEAGIALRWPEHLEGPQTAALGGGRRMSWSHKHLPSRQALVPLCVGTHSTAAGARAVTHTHTLQQGLHPLILTMGSVLTNTAALAKGPAGEVTT